MMQDRSSGVISLSAFRLPCSSKHRPISLKARRRNSSSTRSALSSARCSTNITRRAVSAFTKALAPRRRGGRRGCADCDERQDRRRRPVEQESSRRPPALFLVRQLEHVQRVPVVRVTSPRE